MLGNGVTRAAWASAAPASDPPLPPPALSDANRSAFWGVAPVPAFSNGLGAATLGLWRDRREGAGGGAAGSCVQGPGWMMFSHGWFSLTLETLALGLRGGGHKVKSSELTNHHPDLRGFL